MNENRIKPAFLKLCYLIFMRIIKKSILNSLTDVLLKCYFTNKALCTLKEKNYILRKTVFKIVQKKI